MWWQLLLIQVAFFVILLWVLQKFFRGNLLNAVSRVQGLQQQNLQKERDLKLREQTLKSESEKKTKELSEELAKRRSQIEAELKGYRDAMLQEVEQERVVILAEALEKEKSLERRFKQETQKQGELAACRVIENSLSPKMKELLHHELVNELLEALAKTDIAKIHRQDGEVKVRTPYPLSAREKEILNQRLALHLGAKKGQIEVREESDASLVAGFILILDKTELDGSLANRFRKFLGEPA